jgi:DNA-binding transcriptional LysR family regulator
MTPEQLRTFLTVARHLNFTRAASALHLSQTAAWRQVRHLERELEARLVETFGRQLHLTDAGIALVDEAERLLAHHARVEDAVRQHATGVRGRLRVGASTTPGHHLLPAAIGRFHREHPEVELAYVVENTSGIERRLRRNELDLGFVGGEVLDDDLVAERFVTDELTCVAAPGHPLARRRRLTAADLLEAICVQREPGSSTRAIFESWLAKKGLRLRRTLEVEGSEVVRRLVAAGVGYACMSARAAALEARPRQLVRLAVEGLALQREIVVARQRDKLDSAAATRFLELARSVVGAAPT